MDLSRAARGDPPQTPINFTEMDLTEVVRGEPASIPVKAIEVKLKSNEARLMSTSVIFQLG